jgi:hypothetical protein
VLVVHLIVWRSHDFMKLSYNLSHATIKFGSQRIYILELV